MNERSIQVKRDDRRKLMAPLEFRMKLYIRDREYLEMLAQELDRSEIVYSGISLRTRLPCIRIDSPGDRYPASLSHFR